MISAPLLLISPLRLTIAGVLMVRGFLISDSPEPSAIAPVVILLGAVIAIAPPPAVPE